MNPLHSWYWLLASVFALWTFADALGRKLRFVALAWALGVFCVLPVVDPLYWVLRPLKDGEAREGGFLWNLAKRFGLVWTVTMALAYVAFLFDVGQTSANATAHGNSDLLGAGLGMIFGSGLMAAAWLLPTLGAALVGFFARNRAVVETGPTGTLAQPGAEERPIDAVLVTLSAVVLGLALAFIYALHHTPAQTDLKEPPSSGVASQAEPVPSGTIESNKSSKWRHGERANEIDNTHEVTFFLPSETKVQGLVQEETPKLVLRCSTGKKSELFVSTASGITQNRPYIIT